MAAAHSSPLALPPPANMERLPSIRELHFSYRPPSAQGNNPPPPGQDHPPHPAPPSSRHDPSGWSRPPPSNAPPSSQHSPNMPPPPEHAKHHQATHKADGVYGQPAHGYASHAPAAPASHPKSRGDAPRTSKRGRSDSSVSASAGRSPHTAYPPNYSQVQQSPTAYHPAPGGPSPQPPPEAVQQPSHFPPSGPGYAYHHPPPQHMPPRQQYTQQAPPAQPQQPHTRTPNPYHAPPPPAHEQWQHQQPPPSQQQAPPPAASHPPQAPAQNQQYEFIRTTPIVPAPAEPRGAVAAPIPPPPQRENMVQEIVKCCNTLWAFASKYAQAPQEHPAPDELRDMSYFAGLVVRLLEDLRSMTVPQEQRQNVPTNSVAEEPRVPKRPWEDMSREEGPSAASPNHPELSEENQQSTAEQDMEIIRSKRATSSGTSTPGQPKSKYRKRSRATPPGKCHSCNIRETPEWRRGPDGARTLCNACGLHYAKLMRKRDKTLGADGKPVPIDLQTLRASTASSRGGGGGDQNGDSSQQAAPPPPPHHSGVAVSPFEHTKPGLHGPDSPQHPSPTHAVYHLMPSQGPPSAGAPPPHPSLHPPPQPRSAHEHVGPGGYAPHPPWQVHGSGPSEHTYMRPSHGRGSPH